MWKEAVVAQLEASLHPGRTRGNQCKTSFVEAGLGAETLPNWTVLSTYVSCYVDHKHYANFFLSGARGEKKPARNGKKC
jgi:hypothetical protein